MTVREDELKRKEGNHHAFPEPPNRHPGPGRNNKLCQENNDLAEKHKNLISNYDQRETKALKEKEFALFSLKTQKLERLCIALQDQRKTLYQKLQGSQQPGSNATVSTE
ncbi:beta-taxilin-like [Xyrauchen texanus]|uniref:beta-taxilin-like n=1 Tax=Xyrauchen texanus TaxID=154827 RepID=UPI002242C316|nr:beta-taxilin-like [Xyrauchen texanus]